MKLKQKKIIKTAREQRAQATRRRTAAKARRVEKTQEEGKDESEEKQKVATGDGRAKTDIKEHGSTASLNLYKYYVSARTETLKHVHNTQLPPAPPRGMAALIKSTRHQKLYFATQLAFLFLPLAVLGSAPALLLFDQTEPAPAPVRFLEGMGHNTVVWPNESERQLRLQLILVIMPPASKVYQSKQRT